MEETTMPAKWFLLPLVLILCLVTGVLISVPKADIHIWFNQFYTPWTDVFFRYFTNVGDGLFVIVIALCFGYYKFKKGIIIILAYALSGLIAQFIKHVIVQGTLRPILYLKGIYNLHLIEGVKILSYNSFPSGHTTAAFALFFALSLFTNNKYLQIAYLACAILVAWSRIYLSQHFLIDTFAGALIGICITWFIFKWINPSEKSWINRGLSRK
jgi:membrane-associated phospholipid phosphatase